MTRKLAGLRLPIFIFLFTLAIFFLRTNGVHFDENNYFRAAFHDAIGDARGYQHGVDGKPPLFYALNYLASHTLGLVLGSERFFAPFLFFALFNAWALAWLIGRFDWGRERRWTLLALVLVSPFYLFNGSQLMMELPIIGLECLLLGALVVEGETPFLGTSLILMMMMKESCFPAIVALLGGCYGWRPAAVRKAVKWTAIAYFVSWLVKKICRVGPQQYGGFQFLLDFHRWPSRWLLTSDYLGVWLFYIGRVLLLLVCGLAARHLLREKPSKFYRSAPGAFLVTGLLSLGGMFAVQLAMNVDFARYSYPVIAIGLLAWLVFLVEENRRWMSALVVLSFLAAGANMWIPRGQTYSWWPRFVVREGPQASFLPGVPLMGWTWMANWRYDKVCVSIAHSDRDPADKLKQYFEWALPRAVFFDETLAAGFATCSGAKVVARREPDLATEACRCPGDLSFSFTNCSEHPPNHKDFPTARSMGNLTCLP